jgi:antitoxin YefM
MSERGLPGVSGGESATDDLESLRERLFWLQQPGVREDLADGEHEYAAGETLEAAELRARYGLPRL